MREIKGLTTSVIEGAHEGRDLEADRFPGPGRQNGEHIAPAEHGFHDRLLQPAKPGVAVQTQEHVFGRLGSERDSGLSVRACPLDPAAGSRASQPETCRAVLRPR